MAGDYTLPLAVTDRVRFYDGQFLQDQDFIDEQKYHLARRNRHHRTLHVTGVAEGLTAYAPANTTFQIKVRPGLAIDPDGRQILLTSISPLSSANSNLPAEAAGSVRWLYIAYHQVADKLQASGQGVEGETRWSETPYIFASDKSEIGRNVNYDGPDWSSYLAEGDGPPPPVLLAKLTIDAGGKVSVDNSVRQFSGLRLPGPDSLAPVLRTDAAGNVGLWLVENGDLSERLTISPDGNVGINTNTPSAALEIGTTLTAARNGQALVALNIAPTFDAGGKTSVKNYGLLVGSGNVGIGTTNPGATLDVKGNAVVQSYLLVGQTSATGYQNVTADSNDLIVNGQFAAGGSAGSAIYKLGIGYAPPAQGEGTLIVSGNVGVGTTTPGSKLDVAGETRILAGQKDVVFSQGNFGNKNTTDLFFNKGNVGFNQSEFALFNQNDNVEGNRYFQLQYSADAGGLTIRKGGNVGIGTTAPGEKLEVSGGNIKTNGAFIGDIYKDVKTTAKLNTAGWQRIIQSGERGGSNTGVFEIRWDAPGKHGHVRFMVGANYGDDNGTQITILHQSSYGGKIVEKIRLLINGTYDQHYIEFYFNGGGNDIPFDIYQLSSLGWSLIEPTAGSMPTGYNAIEIRSDVLFAARSGANAGFVVDDDSLSLGATELTGTELAILKKLANSQLKVVIRSEKGYLLDNYGDRHDRGDNDRTIQFRSNTAQDENTKMTLVIAPD
jgi:hypothetical protein